MQEQNGEWIVLSESHATWCETLMRVQVARKAYPCHGIMAQIAFQFLWLSAQGQRSGEKNPDRKTLGEAVQKEEPWLGYNKAKGLIYLYCFCHPLQIV